MATQLPFVLLSPIAGADVWIPTVDPSEVLDSPVPDHFLWLYRELKESKVVVIDVETKGVRTWVADDYVVGLGVAWSKANGEIGVRYFAMRTADDFRLAISALNGIPSTAHVMAHNVNFDAAWIDEMADRVGSKRSFEWTHCTYGLMKQLASEGWENQQWGLKWAMVHLLGWPNSNETELDNWLLGQGYHKQGPSKDPLDSPDAHLAKLKQWVSQGKGKNARKVAPDKGEMWRAPTSILGHYCALDCLSTLDLYQRVLRPVLDKFPEFEWYHTTPWLYVNLLLTEQQRHGIRVDRPAMERHLADLNATMDIAEKKIREAPVLRDGIAAIEEKRKEESLLELKEREPNKLKKDGTPSKGWLNWQQQVLNPKYKEWSPGSSKDLRELLYEGGIVLVEDAEDERMFILHGLNGPVELERTDSGLMSVDSEVLSQLPKEIADPLSEYLDAKKEASIVTSYLELLHHTEDGGWRLHAGWSVPGTLTGRLGGREPNLQAIPKSIKFLDCFIPDPGFTWVEGDFSALEPNILAELSRDKALLDLYGPDANPNHDRYLYTIAGIPFPQFDAVRSHYDVNNPTKDGVKAAKTNCKKLRDFGKVLCVAEDELIRVKDHGWLPIQDITDEHLIWDGLEWVRCGGSILTKAEFSFDLTKVNNIAMTKDHLVLTNKGWVEADEISERTDSAQPIEVRLPSSSWSDVWELACLICADAKEIWLSVCSRLLSSCRKSLGSIRQP
jgi:hypothetical protein